MIVMKRAGGVCKFQRSISQEIFISIVSVVFTIPPMKFLDLVRIPRYRGLGGI